MRIGSGTVFSLFTQRPNLTFCSEVLKLIFKKKQRNSIVIDVCTIDETVAFLKNSTFNAFSLRLTRVGTL